MIILDLKKIIADLPDDMLVGLLDLSTDNFSDCNYSIDESNFDVMDYVEEEDGEIAGKFLAICFVNKLNDNPILKPHSK